MLNCKMPTSSISQLKARLAALQEEWSQVRDELAKATAREGSEDQSLDVKLGSAPEVHILDNAVDGIFTLGASGCLKYINPSGQRMLGASGEDLVGIRLLELLAQRANRRLIREVSRWLKEPGASASFMLVDVPVRNTFGEERWLSLHLQRRLDDGGNIMEVQGIARDITEQHRLQQKLRRSEEHYRGIIENMDLGILEVDDEERIVRAFPKFCAIVGFEEEELLGRKASEVFMRDEDKGKMDQRTAERNSGQSGLYEILIRNKAGEEVWLLISGIPIRDEQGNVVGSMGIHYDITERKRDEQELEMALREVEEARRFERVFLAKMSHEIRTPMNAIIGMAHLLEATRLDEEQRDFVGAISKGGELLKGLLDDILDLARLEEGQFSLNRRPTLVRPLFDGVFQVYGMVLSEKGVDLRLEWDEALDIPLLVDRSALSQVLLNLVGNASKFTDSGSIEIRPSLVKGADGDVLVVSVTDTGCGIPKEEVHRVFDRFQQSDEARQGKEGGSGLGLSIVRELCSLHGGGVEVTSIHGEGSTFKFRFGVEAVPAEDEDQREIDPSFLKGKRVLIAEDNEVNALYLCQLLKRWEVDYTAVGNGRDAFKEWKNGRYDIVLMDIQMPHCDGMEATRMIRSSELPGRPRTPIIGLSAYAFHEDVADGLDSGMDAYLKKPYAPRELAHALMAWS